MEIGPATIPTELLAVARRFRESNLSCDHLRECLNELLGVGPGDHEPSGTFIGATSCMGMRAQQE